MIWLESFFTAALVVAIDQASKAFVLSRWSPVALAAPRSFVSIKCVLNRTVRLHQWQGLALDFIVVTMVGLAVLTLHQDLLGPQAIAPVAIGAAAVGGATGNFLDRFYRGAVVDFVAIGPWPIFNLADVLVAGASLILLGVLNSHA